MSLEVRTKSKSGHALCLPAGLPSEQVIRQARQVL
jgi:hypothetical protein